MELIKVFVVNKTSIKVGMPLMHAKQCIFTRCKTVKQLHQLLEAYLLKACGDNLVINNKSIYLCNILKNKLGDHSMATEVEETRELLRDQMMTFLLFSRAGNYRY